MKKTGIIFLTAIMLLGMIIPVSAASYPFTDVPADSWYAPYIQYVYDNNLMNGTGSTVFTPDANMTRGMVVTVLYRIAGSPSVTGSNPFTDVADGSWYAAPVLWAKETGITSGISATSFAPESDVTREQLVSFIYRYCNFYHGTGMIIGELDEFADADQISDYAKNSMHWAVELGIITGVTGNTLSPQGNATRAQCAAILNRYMEWEKAVNDESTSPVPPIGPQPGAPDFIPDSDPEGITYILNTNTHKFHYSQCRDVAKIIPENYQEYTGSRDILVSQGYSPCGHCDP